MIYRSQPVVFAPHQITIPASLQPTPKPNLVNPHPPAETRSGQAQYGPGYGSDDTQCFSYDYLRRLSQAWTPGNDNCTTTPSVAGLGGAAPYWHSWTIDTTGNRTGQTVHTATGNQTTNYTYPQPSQPRPHTLSATTGASTGNYSNDNAGNVTSRPGPTGQQNLTWDAEGHLATVTEAGSTSSYIYDGAGNRLITKDSTGTTLHLPLGLDIKVGPTGGGATATRTYTHAEQTVASRTTSGLSWLFGDHQQTAGIAVDDTDLDITVRRQAPYGKPRGSTPAWPNGRGFLGGQADKSGLTHLGAREYDTNTGRFISDDPISDTKNPQQMNGYAYANDSPVTLADPDGLKPICGERPGDPCERPTATVGSSVATPNLAKRTTVTATVGSVGRSTTRIGQAVSATVGTSGGGRGIVGRPGGMQGQLVSVGRSLDKASIDLAGLKLDQSGQSTWAKRLRKTTSVVNIVLGIFDRIDDGDDPFTALGKSAVEGAASGIFASAFGAVGASVGALCGPLAAVCVPAATVFLGGVGAELGGWVGDQINEGLEDLGVWDMTNHAWQEAEPAISDGINYVVDKATQGMQAVNNTVNEIGDVIDFVRSDPGGLLPWNWN